MKIAFLPVEKSSKLYSITPLAYFFSYLGQIFPEDLLYPVPDVEKAILTSPEIVVLYQTDTSLFNQVIQISQEIKEKLGVPIILMGNHITYLPKILPDSIDIGIIGEGETQLEKLITLFKKARPDDKVLLKTDGIVFNSKNQKIITGRGKPVFTQDIDSIPLTRERFFNMIGDWQITIQTGRGNPNKNIYTPNSDIPIRLHSVENIVKDIVDIITFFPEVKRVPIMDNVFFHDFTRFKKFCETAKEGKLDKYLNLEVFARIHELNDEVIYLLKNYLKVYKINILLEPFDPQIQKENKLQNNKKENFENILDECYRINIPVEINSKYGYSLETKEDVAKNYWYFRKLNNKYNNFLKYSFSYITPIVGTESWIKAVSKKLITDKMKDWENLSNSLDNNNSLLLSNPNISEIKSSIKEFYTLNEVFYEKEPLLGFIKEKIDDSNESINQATDKLAEYFDKRQGLTKEEREDLSKSIFNVRAKNDISLSYIGEVLNIIDGKLIPDNCKMSGNEIKNNIEECILQGESPEKKEAPKFSKMHIIEEISDTINDPSKKDANFDDLIKKNLDFYNKKNKNIDLDNVFYNHNFLSISVVSTLEQLIKTSDVESILQITDKNFIDLEKIFATANYKINTLDFSFFNKSTLELDNNNKYDSIVIFFALDFTPKISRIMNYCNRHLKENGTIIINFFNAKNIITTLRLLSNFDNNKMFSGYKRNNFFTLDSMNEIIERYNFVPKTINTFKFPEYSSDNIYIGQKFIMNIFNDKLKSNFLDQTIFSYTYTCRRKSRNLLRK